MVSPAAAEKYGDDFHRNPVGTGPYLFKEWIGGDRVSGTRNPDYWRSDKDGGQLPYSNNVTMRFIVEPSIAMIELVSGNVDIIISNLVADLTAAKNDPNLQPIIANAGIHQWCTFNTRIEPFNNEKLRQAISAGIDRETIARVISEGFGQVTPTLIPPGDWIYDADLNTPYTYNPELAKKLLADAGYADGIEFSMSIIKRDPDVKIGLLMLF